MNDLVTAFIASSYGDIDFHLVHCLPNPTTYPCPFMEFKKHRLNIQLDRRYITHTIQRLPLLTPSHSQPAPATGADIAQHRAIIYGEHGVFILTGLSYPLLP